MSHENRPPGAPTSAAGDSIILHVPACVQRFSSRRRILTRLRALARRRGGGLPELDAPPLKLQVEENPNWPRVDEEDESGPVLAIEGWAEESDPLDGLQDPIDAGDSRYGSEGVPPPIAVPPEETGDPQAALIEQLVEDNRDLKAALCRLIRIAEENNAALRLLEEENEELSALVHRLTVAPPPAARRSEATQRSRRWVSGWNAPWLKRRLARRCT